MNFSLGIYSGLCTDLERKSQINGNSENGARFVHAVCNECCEQRHRTKQSASNRCCLLRNKK